MNQVSSLRVSLGILLGCLAIAYSCACSGVSLRTSSYESPVDALEYQSSYRIDVFCPDGTGKYGSAVAITRRHLITAKHVVNCAPVRIIAVSPTGDRWDVDIDAVSTSDAVRLVVDGTGEPFVVHATGTASVSIGERICIIGGGRIEIAWMRKCGDVAGVYDDGIVAALHVVPGNSGGPGFNRRGELVGIVHGGEWDPGAENYVVLIPVQAFRDVMLEQAADLMGDF